MSSEANPLGDAVREEIVVRFVDVKEDSRATDKSSVALYIEQEGIVRDILVLSDQDNKSILTFNPDSTIRFIAKEISTQVIIGKSSNLTLRPRPCQDVDSRVDYE